MIDSETKLIKLIDLIRKDSGVNNAIDAMEQLSLILLLKHFYEVTLIDVPRTYNHTTFRELFYNSKYFSEGKTDITFSKASDILEWIFSDLKYDENVKKTSSRIEIILNNIPLKLRSEKILDSLLCQLDNIDFDGKLSEEYDELVTKMIKDSSSAGAFHTPKALVSAIVKVMSPATNQSIYDPAMGTGRFFVEMQKIMLNNPENNDRQIKAVGQDISPFAYLVCSLSLLFNGVNIGDISLEDSLLSNDDFLYDVILSAVPFGKVSAYERYEYKYDGYSANLEAMFLKHSMKKLALTGEAAIIVPDSLLYNNTREVEELRKELLTEYNLHTILSLPSGALNPFSAVKISVLFFCRRKPTTENIWFYELKTDHALTKNSQLEEGDFNNFIKNFRSRPNSDGSWNVPIEEINEHYHLQPINPFKPEELAKRDPLGIIDELALRFSEISQQNQELRLLASKESNDDTDKTNYTVGEIFKVVTGKRLIKSEIRESKCEEYRYPVYGGNGQIGYHNKFNIADDTIIIGRVGNLAGNIHFAEGPLWVTDNAFSIELTNDQIAYLPYLAKVLKGLNLNKVASGTAQSFISFPKIRYIQLKLPNYEEQIIRNEQLEKVINSSLIMQLELEQQIEILQELNTEVLDRDCFLN